MAVVPSLFSEQSLNKPLFLAGHGKWIPVLEKTAYRVLCLPGRHFIIACGSVHQSGMERTAERKNGLWICFCFFIVDYVSVWCVIDYITRSIFRNIY